MKKYMKRTIALLCAFVLAVGGMYIQSDATTGNQLEEDGVFYDCDSADGVTLTTWANTVTVTENTGEVKDGTGALKSVFGQTPDAGTHENNGNCWFRILKDSTVDFSDYAEGGISFWLYIGSESKEKLTDDAKLRIDFSSTTEVDNTAYRWDVNNVKSVAGDWHLVTLNFADVTKIGNPDLSKINFMRITLSGTDGGYVDGAAAVKGTGFTVLLDDIRGVEPDPTFYNCDSADGVTLTTWANTVTVTENAGEVKDGTGALKSVFGQTPDAGTHENNGDCWFRILKDSTVDLSDYAAGGISFWLYIGSESKEKLTDDAKLRIDFSSTTDVDNTAYRWDVSNVKSVAGDWHLVTLNFADVTKKGNPDLSKINFMRITLSGTDGGYVGGASAVRGTDFTVLLDDIRAMKVGSKIQEYTSTSANPITASIAPSDAPEGFLFAGWYTSKDCESDAVLSGTAGDGVKVFAKFVSEEVLTVKTQLNIPDNNEMAKTVVTNCDNAEDYSNLWAGAVTTNQVKEGIGALHVTGKGQERVSVVLKNAVDISAAGAKLHVSVYISETDYISSDLKVQIASGMPSLNQNRAFIVAKDNLKDGWNELVFDINAGTDTADKNGVKIDLTQVNFVGVLFTSSSAVTNEALVTSVDDVYAYTMPGISLIDCDATADTNNSGIVVATDEAHVKEGMGSYTATAVSNDQVRFWGKFAEKNISSYQADGRLHLWLYIDDMTKVTQNLRIEISSSGRADNQELAWQLQPSYLKTGWNDINLPLAIGTNKSAVVNDIQRLVDTSETIGTDATWKGNFNYEAVNFMRIYFGTNNTTANTVPMYIDDVRVVRDIANLRFVTTVDTLNYKNIGFELQVGSNTPKEYTSKYVYETISGVDAQGNKITYTPSEDFSPWSGYFYTRTLTNIPVSAFDTTITATPFWITQDGTKVMGTPRTITVNGL